MKITVKVEGLAELDAKLALLSQSAGKGVLRRTGRKALVPFDEAWRSKVTEKTGELKKSGGIGSKLTRSARKGRERESTVEVFAGPGPNPQAITEEFGTFQQAAHPAVRPAWDETKDRVLEIVKDELGNEIARAAKRSARKAAKAAAEAGE